MPTLFKVTLKEVIPQLASEVEQIEADLCSVKGEGNLIVFSNDNEETVVAIYNRDVVKKITSS